MKKFAILTLCVFLTVLSSVCSAQVSVPTDKLVMALGKVKDAGRGRFDFKRSKDDRRYDFRLQKLVIKANPRKQGSLITGSYTLTFLDGAWISNIPTEQFHVTYSSKDGQTTSKVMADHWKKPWAFTVKAGATVPNAPPADWNAAAEATNSLGHAFIGDHALLMGEALVALAERLATLSDYRY